MIGTILRTTVPATIIMSARRGDAEGTSNPNRAQS